MASNRPTTVVIKETDPGDSVCPDCLRYRCKYFEWSIPGTQGWADNDFSFPYDIYFLSASFVNNSTTDGDEAEFVIAPDTAIGSLSADEASGQTVLSVSSTVMDNVEIGQWVKLTDGTNTDDCGEVVDYDEDNSTITVSTATTNSFAAATPTYVKITVPVAEQIYFEGSNRIDIGFSKVGGTLLPANTTARLRFKNNDGQSKKFRLFIEYLLRGRK